MAATCEKRASFAKVFDDMRFWHIAAKILVFPKIFEKYFVFAKLCV
jgi:hypothetical protein